MGFLPVKTKLGGAKGGGLKLKTDMTGIGNKKANSPKAGKVGSAGSIYKNPGGKHDGSNSKIARKRA